MLLEKKSVYASLMNILIPVFTLSFTFSAFGAPPSESYIATHALEMSADLGLPEEALRTLNEYRVIALGEVHGNDRSPELATQITRQLSQAGPVILALEIPRGDQGRLHEFIRTGNSELLRQMAHFQHEFKDGRSSQAMAHLLESVRGLPNVQVGAFDVDQIFPQTPRDEMMAQKIIDLARANPKAKILMFAGNYHTSLKYGAPFDPEFNPALRELFTQAGSPFQRSDVFNLRIRYSTGSSWICFSNIASECGAKPINGVSNYSRAVGYDQYYLLEPAETDDGYLATVFLRSVTASLPF